MPDIYPSAETVATMSLGDKLHRLHDILDRMGSIMVAFSGGVDSSFLLKAAVDRKGKGVVAITADSPTIPRSELQLAKDIAGQIGARHEIVETNELDDADFVANPPDRCYHCKKTLFGTLADLAGQCGVTHLVEGSNYSDMSDYRPGTRAIDEYEVCSPLKEAGLTKEDIRELSHQAGLPTWDKPAAPCLSSRIPYGSVITLGKLNRIEKAEKFLRTLGLREFRVRDHGDIARLEVPPDQMSYLIEADRAAEITDRLKSLGYNYVTIDLLGFRSGSLNEVLEGDTDE